MSIPMLRSIAVAAWSAILIVCLAPAGVAAPLVVDGRTSRYSLSSAAEFVEAASCAVEPGEAFARGTARRSEGEAPNFGMSRSAMWARVDIDWQASADRNWWLVVRQGVVDEVRVVLPAAGIAARDLRSGIAVARSHDPSPSRRVAIALPAAGIDGRLYVCMYSEGPLRFPILLVDGATFQRWEALDYAMLAFSCGILVGLAIYLGFMWRALRESHLAWLGLMALCLFASLVSSYNLMAEFVTPMLQPSARLAGLGFGYATIACGNLFVIAFLDLRRLDRRLWLVAWAICLACAAMTVVAIFDARVGRVGVALLGLLTGVCDLAALVLGARRRVPHAWALLLAWLPGHVGTGVLHVIALSIPVPVEITGNMGYAGAMLATLMMTIVAIDRQRSRREGVVRALRESETRFRDFASAASDWLWETDAGLRYTYFGGGAMTAIGFEPARALGKTPGELLDLHPAENPAALWRDVGERKAFRNIVFGFRRGAGGRGYLSVSGVPIHDDAGVFRGYRGVATDVTDAVLGEDARRRREKLAALGQLAGGMAHELNNLLHPILNFAGEAARAVPDTMPATRRHLGIVADCARKAADIVSRVLAFARGEAARSEPTDLAGAVVDALVLADALLPPETTIRREIDRAAGTARVAPAEVTQVILNLVTNAAQAMPAGGTIGVSLARASRGDGRASASLVVTDQGRGIEASVKARLFEPFFTTRAGAGGTGLGLSVVYGIVQGWGGDIAVDNGRDGGARVEVEILLMEAT